jgi:hypothetical protein
MVAFVVPIALSSSANAGPGDPTTTTSLSVSTTTSTTLLPPTTTSTTIAPTTTTTQMPTTTTASPPVNGEGIVIVGESGDRIRADGGVSAQATDPVLAHTGSSPEPVWLTGIACLASGALALTFKRRRHLSLYQLRAKRS